MALAEQVKRLYELYVNRPSGFTLFVPNQGKEFFNFARNDGSHQQRQGTRVLPMLRAGQ